MTKDEAMLLGEIKEGVEQLNKKFDSLSTRLDTLNGRVRGVEREQDTLRGAGKVLSFLASVPGFGAIVIALLK